jgi:hypothetical protein
MIRQLVNWDKKDYWTKNQQQNYEEAANERFFVLFHTRLFQVQTMASEFNLSLLRIPLGDNAVYQGLVGGECATLSWRLDTVRVSPIPDEIMRIGD